MKNLDDYITSFYDEAIEKKIQSSKMILELFQDFGNLEALLEHGKDGGIQTRCSQC